MTCSCVESAGIVTETCGAHQAWLREVAKKRCEYEAHKDIEIKIERLKAQLIYQTDRANMLEELLVSAFNKRKMG